MTKMVQLSEEAYARLRSLKRDDESFSDAVLRLAGRGQSLRSLAGLRTPAEIDEAERLIAQIDLLDRS